MNGNNEMIRNFSGDAYDITAPEGHALAVRCSTTCAPAWAVQEENGPYVQPEATPAEGTTYRFAREDRKRYTTILQAGTVDIRITRIRRSCP